MSPEYRNQPIPEPISTEPELSDVELRMHAESLMSGFKEVFEQLDPQFAFQLSKIDPHSPDYKFHIAESELNDPQHTRPIPYTRTNYSYYDGEEAIRTSNVVWEDFYSDSWRSWWQHTLINIRREPDPRIPIDLYQRLSPAEIEYSTGGAPKNELYRNTPTAVKKVEKVLEYYRGFLKINDKGEK